MILAPKLAFSGPRVLEPGCAHRMPVRGSLLQAPHGATSPTHPPSVYPRPSAQEQRPCPAAAGSQCSGPHWAFPDRQAASADRSFFRSSRPRGLCSLETFFQTGLAEPGHGPQWVLWARTRGPGPTAHAGGLADAPGRTGPPDVVPGSSAGLRAQSQNQQLLRGWLLHGAWEPGGWAACRDTD